MVRAITVHDWPGLVDLMREREAFWRQALLHRADVEADEDVAARTGQLRNSIRPTSPEAAASWRQAKE